jgi:hypothetical protein
MQTPQKSKVEVALEKINAKKQKLDVTVVERNSTTTTLSVKMTSSTSKWVDHKTIIVMKVDDNDYIELDSTDDETSNDDFADLFLAISSSQNSESDVVSLGDIIQKVADVVVPTPVEPEVEIHPCVRPFPVKMDAFEWTASADSLEDLVTFNRVLSTGKTIVTSYIPIAIKPDSNPMPLWIGCTAFRQRSDGDNSCGEEAIGVAACCSGFDAYCLGHIPHYSHEMCADDESEFIENQRRAEDAYIEDDDAYQQTIPSPAPVVPLSSLCNCYCQECVQCA